MRTVVQTMVVVAALVATVLLTGCPKKAVEPQGAPAMNTPAATHTMPNGQQMPGMQHPAASDAPAKATSSETAADTASCPVLGTTMAKKDMIPYEYKGKTYYFCCESCVTKFKADPEKYLQHPAKPLPLGEPMPSG